MPFVSGFLRFCKRGHPDNELPSVPDPVDPSYGVEAPVRPGHDLPGRDRPVDPGYGMEEGRPGHDLPRPPWVGAMWPPGPLDPDWGVGAPVLPSHPIWIPSVGIDNSLPLPPGRPPRPGHDLPNAPVRPGHDLPNAPVRPGHDLPNAPVRPDNILPGQPPSASTKPLPPGGPPVIDNTLPPVDAPPGTIWPPLPPDAPVGKAALVLIIPGVGHRYVVIDVPPPVAGTKPVPPAATKPIEPVDPTAEPKDGCG